MSDSIVEDIMTLLSELGYGQDGVGIYNPQQLALRKPTHGIMVEQRTSSPIPDVLNHTDTVYLDIEVRGRGEGEIGRADAIRTAMALYRDLSLIVDRTINGTLYLLITTDTSVHELADGSYDQVLGLQVIRYYEELE